MMKQGIIGVVIVLAAAALIAAIMLMREPARAEPTPEAQTSEAEKMMHASDCFSCHAADKQLVGPAYDAVAGRYAKEPRSTSVPKLIDKIRKGGAGNWGTIPMAPHLNLTNAQLKTMVVWILSLKAPAAAAKAPAKRQAKTYSYKHADGKTVTLSFPVFDPGDHKVTADVFAGWEQYNSYCFRCHGADVLGSEYAPDLKASINGGMTWQQFLSTTMSGRTAKGMPRWAGFFETKEVRQIYEYVKARSAGVLPPGRPPSATD
jgi:cytochrome c